MFSSKSYTVRKFPLKYLIDCAFCVTDESGQFQMKQQDNLLFRQIRLITHDNGNFNQWIIFVDAKGGKSYEDGLRELAMDGFLLNGRRFVMGERSASMTRTGILSFVDAEIASELDVRVSMGLKIDKTVLSKWYAYRGLMLSACHCFADWRPKIVIIPDYTAIIPNQSVKYVYDNETEFIDKDGQARKWKQKDIAQDMRDIEINAFDGCGIHHPSITKFVQEKLGARASHTPPTSILWRAPFIKGVTHEMDYTRFFAGRGVTSIRDVWGVAHAVTPDAEPMIIMTLSMYKGYQYFYRYGDKRDWLDYWRRFAQYNHCIGVAKWNFSFDEEPVYTKGNYQIFQDLDLPYDRFAHLAKDSVDFVEKIASGDFVSVMCFLGLFADKHTALNDYVAAVLKNPEMLREYSVRHYLVMLMKKYMDDMKCGKLYLKACFKFLAPDLILLMEHAGGLKPEGCLQSNEFYAVDRHGAVWGKRLIERNPHICRSEHVVLEGVDNPLTRMYCSHLANVCMINSKSITAQRLNGGDFDGDLVLLIDNALMMSGVHSDIPVVIDIDDKVTVEPEEDTKENKLKIILRTMNSLIGETSNCATAYHNKTPKTEEQKRKYAAYIDLLSVINGKSIDYAKTGVLFQIPRNIAKYGRPLPYFMKYRGPYYSKLKKLSRSNSNMNRLCWELERWERGIRWQRKYTDFDYTIMMNREIPENTEMFQAVEEIFLDFCKEMYGLAKEQRNIRSETDAFDIDWAYYYDKYKRRCQEVCPDVCRLANICVRLCYEKYPQKNRKFIWVAAGDGIVENIQQVKLPLPIRDDNGTITYLGNHYRLEELAFD